MITQSTILFRWGKQKTFKNEKEIEAQKESFLKQRFVLQMHAVRKCPWIFSNFLKEDLREQQFELNVFYAKWLFILITIACYIGDIFKSTETNPSKISP